MTSLRIIRRNGMYVVQVGKKKLFRRELFWTDMRELHFKNQMLNLRYTGLMLPIIPSIFATQEEAEDFCQSYLTVKRKPEDHEVKTYNTGLHDMFWANRTPMPKCKPPRSEKDNQ